MDKKIRNRLINALKGVGMSAELASNYEGLTDEALEKVISGLEAAKPQQPTMDQIVESEAFTTFINAGGFDTLLSKNPAAQSVFDAKLAKGFNTRMQNWLKKEEEKGKGKPGDKNKAPDLPADTPAWAKSILESNQALQAKVDSLEKERKGEQTLEQAKALMAKSKLPENIQGLWLSRIQVDSDIKLEDQVKALEEEHAVLFPNGAPGAQPGDGGAYKFDQSRQTKAGELSQTDKEDLKNFAKSVKVR